MTSRIKHRDDDHDASLSGGSGASRDGSGASACAVSAAAREAVPRLWKEGGTPRNDDVDPRSLSDSLFRLSFSLSLSLYIYIYR